MSDHEVKWGLTIYPHDKSCARPLGGSIIAAVTMCVEPAGSTNRRDVR